MLAAAVVVLGAAGSAVVELMTPDPIDWSTVGSREFAQAASQYEIPPGSEYAVHDAVAHALAHRWAKKAGMPDPTVVCGRLSAKALRYQLHCVVYSIDRIEITCNGFPPPIDGGGCWETEQ